MTLYRCWILSWADLWSHLLRFTCSILAVLLYLPFPGTAALCCFLSHVVCGLLLLLLVLLACFSICFIDALIIIVKYFRTFLAKRERFRLIFIVDSMIFWFWWKIIYSYICVSYYYLTGWTCFCFVWLSANVIIFFLVENSSAWIFGFN